MDRSDVYQHIDGERDYQDAKWGSITDHPHELLAWANIMRHYLDKTYSALSNHQHQGANQSQVTAAIRKTVAVGVAALEQYGCWPREGYEPRAAPESPRADWSQAPRWAKWWAVNAMGAIMWFASEPTVAGTGWNFRGRFYKYETKYTNIPLGIDWRLLKERRPEPAP